MVFSAKVLKKSAIILSLFIFCLIIGIGLLIYVFYLRKPVMLFNYISDFTFVKTVPSRWIRFDTPFFINLSDDKPNFFIGYKTTDNEVGAISKIAVVGTPAFSVPIDENQLAGEGEKTFELNVIIDDVPRKVIVNRDNTRSYWFQQDFAKNPDMSKYNFYNLESVSVETEGETEIYDNRGKQGLMYIEYGYKYLLPGDLVNLVWETPANFNIGWSAGRINDLIKLPVGEITRYGK